MVKKLLFVLLANYFVLITFLHADSVEASVNTQEVVNGNSVLLSIKAVGKSVEFPKIDQINGVDIADTGSSKSTSMSITPQGMVSETSIVKKYLFVPTHDMTIPAYTVNISGVKYKTKPISIKVVQSQAPAIQNSTKSSFVLKSDKKSVYVGESFVVSLYISIPNTLKNAQIGNFSGPTSQDFFIKPVDGQKDYQVKDALVIKKQYIVTAKKEGNLTINSAYAKLGQADRSKRDIFGRYGIRWSPIASNSLGMEVKAQEKDTDLVGSFKINTKIDTQKVKANKPVNLTIEIKGKGNLEDFEFPKYEIDGVTIYSDKAKIESHLEGTVFMSTYTKSFAFISDGNFSIPKRSITMYDPDTKKEIVLEVKQYDIDVEGKKVTSAISGTSAVPTKAIPEKKVKEIVVEKKEKNKIEFTWMYVLSFFLGGISVYLLRYIPDSFGRKDKSYKESEVLKILYSHISKGEEVEEMVRKLYARKNGDKSVNIDKKELKDMVDRFR